MPHPAGYIFIFRGHFPQLGNYLYSWISWIELVTGHGQFTLGVKISPAGNCHRKRSTNITPQIIKVTPTPQFTSSFWSWDRKGSPQHPPIVYLTHQRKYWHLTLHRYVPQCHDRSMSWSIRPRSIQQVQNEKTDCSLASCTSKGQRKFRNHCGQPSESRQHRMNVSSCVRRN